MTVVSSKEFVSNQTKYYNMAAIEEVFIKRGKNMFIVTRVNEQKESKYLSPDEDLRRAIPIDELRRRVKEDIHQWYKERNESSSAT